MGAVCATIPNINANICTNIAIAGSKVYEDSKFIDSSVELSFSCLQPSDCAGVLFTRLSP